jgi:hypothetical protein
MYIYIYTHTHVYIHTHTHTHTHTQMGSRRQHASSGLRPVTVSECTLHLEALTRFYHSFYLLY